ncbi:hypothetical protein CAPTEDRAFT_172660 [Capitella teleta]|uniref:Fatty acid hydroxylase domain-containing protein n=1 Tax=Capitella teleta TaxID=283909 RepID=R7T7B7_CAPTE|nr:hypothetical protein CAPTEDRAFT_172660 [Capitella teleta]|eukprot:ELT89490.1 hypothetical protein CAPTEDRAFT_172660 [Capitella teleta]
MPVSSTEQKENPDRASGVLYQVRQLWDSIRMTLFVVGSALIVFTCFCNSITWYFQRFWGASGDFWQNRWQWVWEQFHGDAFAMGVWGTTLVGTVSFWIFNALLMILDYFSWPKVLLKYKIQEDKNMPVDGQKMMKAVLWVMFNQTVIGIPFIYISYLMMLWRGCDFGPVLPSFHCLLFHISLCILVEEVFFYYGHRLFHTPMLYKRIHKMHHEWTAPIGITALYAHPVEHVLCNLLPPVLGPIFLGSHIAAAWIWFALALISTTVSHSGYHLPLLPSPEAHDFHHAKFVNNFGVLGVLDHLHGTDTMFLASKEYQRHFILLGLTPLSQQFPADPKKVKEAQAGSCKVE